jgi:hypothetical protein
MGKNGIGEVVSDSLKEEGEKEDLFSSKFCENKSCVGRRISALRVHFLSHKTRPTGHASGARYSYDYFALHDFMPECLEGLEKYRLFAQEEFYNYSGLENAYPHASLKVQCFDCGNVIRFSFPLPWKSKSEPEAPGSSGKSSLIQEWGALNTFSRRYLYIQLLELSEQDTIAGTQDNANASTPPPPPSDDASSSLRSKIDAIRCAEEGNEFSKKELRGCHQDDWNYYTSHMKSIGCRYDGTIKSWK